ncbi:conserved hypothetical protein [Ricinus communis]|uniref:Uncharacterized protein n=1 Tax=Ricinus communis TaxID=3988 RepID=B9SJ42_RICCO|nr:conserved hypothetical protein [Ricinus communis]
MAAPGGCARPIKSVAAEYAYLFENQLPRGPVPPSGPSKCHNKYSQIHGLDTMDYIICP